MDKPTIYVTNWSSRKLHGPGRKWTIMRKPRAWEWGDGRVEALTPDAEDLDAARSGAIGWSEYERGFLESVRVYLAACEETWGHTHLGPDRNAECETGLHALPSGGKAGIFTVRDGDTLLCACAKGKPCHRQIAARLLADSNWRVILDGQEVVGGSK